MRSPDAELELIIKDPATMTQVELAVYARVMNLQHCECGAVAVLRYFARDPINPPRWGFDWPRCAQCPGATYAKGRDGFGIVHVRGVPMEPKYRKALKAMGVEDAFVASLRLGYRPESYGHDGKTIEGKVDIDPSLWEREPWPHFGIFEGSFDGY